MMQPRFATLPKLSMLGASQPPEGANATQRQFGTCGSCAWVAFVDQKNALPRRAEVKISGLATHQAA
jgi:hypothetical protein